MLLSDRSENHTQEHELFGPAARSRLRRPRRRLRWLLAAAVVAIGAVLAAVVLSPHRQFAQHASVETSAASVAAQSFLNEYVDTSGRVVRRDQGNDTVSEGQAYALLLAEAAGDQATFDRIWTWTRSHLQEPNGLFAFRANANGGVIDPQPASDADVLIAWALMRMHGPRAAEYHRAGLQVANAVLAHETARRGDTLMLAAGPWATGQPVTLDPSYWAPVAFEQLADATHDSRWIDLANGTSRLSAELTSDGSLLPPDWARVDRTVPVPEPAPNQQSHFVQYGLDAQRLVIWLATSCNAGDRRLAARLDPLLTAREDALALAPDGLVIDQQTNATPIIAAAAAAQAAGNVARRDSLFERAVAENRTQPTYYGSAWIALGKVLLTTRLLGGCPEIGS